ncbi:MAG: GNAT family N-acetyltransferase [Betaproteobacteria bacterium]|nr:MAG: GNAT family N-acetyltransferase [Betaproteobacteria bacterium]
MVAPAPAIACCGSEEFDALLALLDQEFVFGKGRRLSLQQRFPATLDRQRARNILLARADGGIASALVTKTFTWITPERNWRAAMIGMVYTRPELRARGVASALMRASQAKLAEEGIEFAVLWTAQPDFYARLGWSGIDCGTLGHAHAMAPDASRAAPPPGEADIAWAEALRPRYAPERAERTERTYATLLPPAQHLELLRGDAAYAIVGRDGDQGYLYEMLGDSAELPTLWARLATRYRSLYLNLGQGTAAQRFLSARDGIAWQPQRLAMWLPLAASARDARFADWYVPFLDRI